MIGICGGNDNLEAEDGAIEYGLGYADEAKLLSCDAGNLLKRLSHARQALGIVSTCGINEQNTTARIGDSTYESDMPWLP